VLESLFKMTRGMLGDKYVKRNDVKRREEQKAPPL
jgi:hypothetical protein